jgi:hypothetical protein
MSKSEVNRMSKSNGKSKSKSRCKSNSKSIKLPLDLLLIYFLDHIIGLDKSRL